MFTKIINLFMSLVMFISSLIGGAIGTNKNQMISYNLTKTEATVSIQENPSTGYKWKCEIMNETVAIVSNDKFVDNSPADVVGAPGTRMITFKGLKEGTTKIILSYDREWEDTTPIRMITLMLTVDAENKLNVIVFSDTGDF